jgi:Uma2 family endonuclease
LTSPDDDESVVVGRSFIMTVEQYFAGDETLQRHELRFGMLVREPSSTFGHQAVVGRLFAALHAHVRERDAGVVVTAPMDVILDRERALIVQPDLLFVSWARMGICAAAIEGAPDLVVEVLSPGTRRHDATTKLEWYRRYGVREYWLVDPIGQTIDVRVLPDGDGRTFQGDEAIVSAVLPALSLTAAQIFDSRL